MYKVEKNNDLRPDFIFNFLYFYFHFFNIIKMLDISVENCIMQKFTQQQWVIEDYFG